MKWFDQVIRVAIYDERASDATLSRIGDLTALEYLSFSEAQTTDAGLANLSGLTKLE